MMTIVPDIHGRGFWLEAEKYRSWSSWYDYGTPLLPISRRDFHKLF